MVKIYKQPFAHDGDAIAIPDASQPDGKMSGADGWTPDYQLPKTDPNYKPVGRQEMNGVFKEVTESLGQVQVQGAASWSIDGAPYPINAQVYHDGKQWIALRANSVEPAEGEDWKVLDLSSSIRLSEPIEQVPDAETVQEALVGLGEFAGAVDVDFTIIYPNGGTEESPANVSINSRYVMDNPFPGYSVICVAEVLYNGAWADSGWSSASTSTLTGYGAKATQLTSGAEDSVVVQTGRVGVLTDSGLSGGGHGGVTTITTPLPCRVKAWKVKGAIA